MDSSNILQWKSLPVLNGLRVDSCLEGLLPPWKEKGSHMDSFPLQNLQKNMEVVSYTLTLYYFKRKEYENSIQPFSSKLTNEKKSPRLT